MSGLVQMTEEPSPCHSERQGVSARNATEISLWREESESAVQVAITAKVGRKTPLCAYNEKSGTRYREGRGEAMDEKLKSNEQTLEPDKKDEEAKGETREIL